MTLHFIDVSNWQAGLKLANTDAQAVIAKATESTGYVDPYCDGFIGQAKKLDLPYGTYHFASNSSGEAQARFYLDNVGGYVGHGVLVLDWENGAGWAAEAKKFLDYVKKQTGVTPWVYTVKSYLSSAGAIQDAGYPLWIAYPSSADSYGSVSPWSSALAWQYSWEHPTGGMKVDADRFYGSRGDWAAHASGGKDTGGSGGDTVHVDVFPTRCRITTPYGAKGDMWADGMHHGDDWSCGEGDAEIGDTVVAVADGTVIYAADARDDGGGGWGSAFGKHVLVEWDDHGLTSIYAHLSKINTSKGSRVKVGQKIGEKGKTGNVTGAHLHFECHTGTRWTDPDVKPIYPGKEAAAPATDDEEFAMSEQTTQKRTQPQTVKPDSGWHEIRIEDSGDLSFGFGGGAYQVDARFVLTDLTPSEELLVRVVRFDTDKDKDNERIEDSEAVYWSQGLTGGSGKSFRPFHWQWHVPAPKSGHGRRLRLEVQNNTDHDVTIESVYVATWKASLN